MTELEAKLDLATARSSPPSNTSSPHSPNQQQQQHLQQQQQLNSHKKSSRKNKTPLPFYRSSSSSTAAGTASEQSSGASPPPPPVALPQPLRRGSNSASMAGSAATVGSVPPNPPAPGASPPAKINSYSDFMRSLAAKYNNNDPGSAPTVDPLADRSLKLASALPPHAAAAAAAAGLSSLLPPGAFGLTGSQLLAGFGVQQQQQAPPQPQQPIVSTASESGASSKLLSQLPPGLPPSVLEHLSNTQALINQIRNASSSSGGDPHSALASSASKRPATPPTTPPSKTPSTASPLDLSGNGSPPPSTGPVPKRRKLNLSSGSSSSDLSSSDVLAWTVGDVAQFVESIDICKEYAEIFREHVIDGSSLALLTEEHMTRRLGMKLGPALKLRARTLRRMGPAFSELCVHCAHCQARLQNSVVAAVKEPDSSPPPPANPADEKPTDLAALRVKTETSSQASTTAHP